MEFDANPQMTSLSGVVDSKLIHQCHHVQLVEVALLTLMKLERSARYNLILLRAGPWMLNMCTSLRSRTEWSAVSQAADKSRMSKIMSDSDKFEQVLGYRLQKLFILHLN